MFTLLFAAYSLTHLGVVVSLVRLRSRGPAPAAVIVALVSAGLVYDNALIASGAGIGAGPLLESLSWPRFALHAAFTPFLMLAVWQLADAAGVSWTRRAVLRYGLWLLMPALSLYGITQDLLGLELQTACLGDTLRYTASTPPPQFCSPDQVALAGHGPPIPSIATVIVCLILGERIWRQSGWPWLAVAAALMFFAAGLPAATLGPSLGNAGEVILQMGLAASAWRFAPGGQRGA